MPASAPPASAVAWGRNNRGQLGTGGAALFFDAPLSSSGLSGVTAVSGGEEFALALLENGTVMAWGGDFAGELGNGSSGGFNPAPAPVSGLSEVSAIAAGGNHGLALLKNGTVMAWGYNVFGQLGVGGGPETCESYPPREACSRRPVHVPGLSDVTAIAAGQDYSLALLANGTVMAWGFDQDGGLGTGATLESDVPIPVSGLSEVTAIGDSIALLRNGTVMDWGGNESGELGDGTSTGPERCGGTPCSRTPVAVTGLSGVAAIPSAGGGMALLEDGTVVDWGPNYEGELGDGTTTGPETCDGNPCSTTPVAVSGLTGVTGLAGGPGHRLALLSNGTVMTWNGYNTDLSGEEPALSDVPVPVVALAGATAIAAGQEFSLAAGHLLPVVSAVEPAEGPTTGGTAVTIAGRDLSGATAVRFGSAPATSFTVGSENYITAVSPPGGGTVDVTVENASGPGPTSSADEFTYVPPPPPNPPVVVTAAAAPVTQTAATLNATVNPEGTTVSACRFEFGISEAYGSSVPCFSGPGSGQSPVAVAASLAGLASSTTYHFRIVATNSGGTSYGSDETFSTQSSNPIPAYWYKSGVRLKPGVSVPIVLWGNAMDVSLGGGVSEISCKTVASGSVENPSGGGTGVGEMLATSYYECKQPRCEAEIAESALGGLGYRGVGFAVAYNLPWRNELAGASSRIEDRIGASGDGNLGAGFPEGYPALSQPPAGHGTPWGAAGAIGLITGCEVFPDPEGAAALGGVSGQPQRVASEVPLEGELRPEIGGALNDGDSAANPAQVHFNGKASGELADPLGPGNAGIVTGNLKYLGYATQSPIKVE